MFLGYFDEFGHNGAYVSRDHAHYKTHPAFGIGGILLPAESVRQFSSGFKRLKESVLASEIQAKVVERGGNVDLWEKKGSSLLTSNNVEKYPEVKSLLFRMFSLIRASGGHVCFYGQQKEIGPPGSSRETNASRHAHIMKQLITRIDRGMMTEDSLLMVLDEQGNKQRLEIYAEAAAFMFSNPSGRRLIEPPMQVESHLYQTVQAADWICALLGRISAYKFDPDFHEFCWASKFFGSRLASLCLASSKIRGLQGAGRASVHPQQLGSLLRCFAPDPTAK